MQITGRVKSMTNRGRNGEREREGVGMRERFKPSATPFPSSETWKEKGAEIKCTYRKISRDRD